MRRWIWSAIALGATLVIAVLLFLSAVPLRSETLKKRIVETLAQRLDGEVSLDDVSLHVFPRLRAVGTGLVIRQHGREGLPPLISIKEFEVDADVLGVWRKHVAHVQLKGLDISVPPGRDDDDDKDRPDHRLHSPEPGNAPKAEGRIKKPHRPGSIAGGVVIDTLESDDARLIIVPRQAGKTPKTWAIHTLTMRNVSAEQAMPYAATLTNGVPPGEIVTEGSFGPWNREDPGSTPLNGTFTFDKADLSVFNGIRGTLSAKGSFEGSLGYIEVHGQTTTPDFLIEVGGHPFPLHATYHTIVDGTNGDTRLEQIDAQFLQSSLTAKGAVLDGPPGQKGRTVSLDITMSKARIEDVMTMAVNTKRPPMTGGLQLTSKFLLPPGETDVAERLKLNGRFTMTHARFTDDAVQSKIVELSHRGRGKNLEASREQVASDFRGRFVLGNGRLSLNELMFAVPGAQVKLAGSYALKPETLAFKGDLLMDAKVSQTVSGIKSLLLKIADPLFRKPGGGSSIPIKIEGNRNDPKFGLDMGRVFKRGD